MKVYSVSIVFEYPEKEILQTYTYISTKRITSAQLDNYTEKARTSLRHATEYHDQYEIAKVSRDEHII